MGAERAGPAVLPAVVVAALLGAAGGFAGARLAAHRAPRAGAAPTPPAAARRAGPPVLVMRLADWLPPEGAEPARIEQALIEEARIARRLAAAGYLVLDAAAVRAAPPGLYADPRQFLLLGRPPPQVPPADEEGM